MTIILSQIHLVITIQIEILLMKTTHISFYLIILARKTSLKAIFLITNVPIICIMKPSALINLSVC